MTRATLHQQNKPRAQRRRAQQRRQRQQAPYHAGTLQQRWEGLRNTLRRTRDESRRVLALERETIGARDTFLASDPGAAAISASWSNGVENRRTEVEAVEALRAAHEESKRAAAEANQAQKELRAAQEEERRALAKIEAARAKARAAAQRESQSDLILAPAANVVRAPVPTAASAPAPEPECPAQRASRQVSDNHCVVCRHPNVGRSSGCPILVKHRGTFVGKKGPKKE